MGYYDKAIDWLQKSVQLQPYAWMVRTYLVSAYALTRQLGNDAEADAALSEYRVILKNWSLQKVQDWFKKHDRNPHPSFAATLQELYKGLQRAGL